MAQLSYVDRTMQQVKISDDLKKALKNLAAERDTYVNLLCDEAMESFFKYRIKQPNFRYYAAPKDGKIFSFWLDLNVMEKVRHQADQDNVSHRQVLYAAIVHFLDENASD